MGGKALRAEGMETVVDSETAAGVMGLTDRISDLTQTRAVRRAIKGYVNWMNSNGYGKICNTTTKRWPMSSAVSWSRGTTASSSVTRPPGTSTSRARSWIATNPTTDYCS